MGTSKQRKNHKAKIDNKKTLRKMSIRRQIKDFEEFKSKERENLTEKYANMAKATMPIDQVTQQILSPRDAMIAGLAENYNKNNGASSTSMLMTNIYDK